MKSEIKTFMANKNDLPLTVNTDIWEYMNRLKELACNKFDTWREKEKPNILGITLDTRCDCYLEGSHYWKIDALYESEV